MSRRWRSAGGVSASQNAAKSDSSRSASEYSSGDQQHRGHITKAGNRHARRLLVETAWHYRHAPRRPVSGPQPDARAWHAQVRLHHRYRHLTEHGKRSTVVNIAIARELTGFLWAAMTNQPDRKEELAA